MHRMSYVDTSLKLNQINISNIHDSGIFGILIQNQ